MKNKKMLVLMTGLAWTLMWFANVMADQKCVDPKIVSTIFEQMKMTEIYPQQRTELDCNPEFYISVKKISLATNRETYLVESKRAPFYGSSGPIFWVYEKTGNVIRQLADIEGDKIVVSKSSHNDYQDIKASNLREGKTTTFIFTGEKYVDR